MMKKIMHLRYWLTKLTALCALAFSFPLHADPLLNGVATHIELGKEQFIAGLFTSTLSESANSILSAQEDKRLQVRVLAKNLSSRRFKRMWIEGMAINSTPAELEKHARNMAAFSNMLKIKMISGDIFTVDRQGENVVVSINGARLGEIDDPKFFDLLLRTWIGPVPLSTEFREALLSEGVIKPGPLSRFESTRPNDQRIALLEQAIAAKAGGEAPIANNVTQAQVSAPARPAVSAPVVAAAPVQIDAPQIAAPSTTEEEPEPTPAPQPKATPKPQIALAPKQEELDESIFEDEEDDEFTAESLLKQQLYYSQLAKYTHRYIKYPERAWQRGREGNVRLRVTINREGKVINTEVLEEARYKTLNKAAVKAVGRASPYPAMPDEIKGDDYSFTFRIAFKIPAQ